ncbi:MAG: phosphodiester glycosidase family protein [Leptolyngbyaceae cyanobacterium CSU_1_3]|nr:phosphodiester glycosidase family protein [Leptolyngbyaceae cyanobacterium CSU_1_3]
MRSVGRFFGVGVGVGIVMILIFRVSSLSVSVLTRDLSSTISVIRYQSKLLSHSVAHIVTIPLYDRFIVTPALADGTDQVENFARRERAIAVINGGFFDPVNQQSTSYIVLNGEKVADPKQNDRLTSNPDLKPYLEKIFNRSELRRYVCGQKMRYEFAFHQDAIPLGCRLEDSLGAGCRLLPRLTDQSEAFTDLANGRDAIGVHQRNARSAIGLTDDALILVMVAQNAPSNSGMSLGELAKFMQSLGAKTAMNLDGGSSSALHYQGKTFYGKVDENGKTVQRSIKSVLVVKQK